MDNRLFGPAKLPVSLLGMGCMRLPTTGKDNGIDFEAAQKILLDALAGGVNYVDTAYFYHEGHSEGFVGKALADVERASYLLATKMPVYMIKQAEDAPRLFEEQLQRCNTDYFDFYLLHALSAETFERSETLGVYTYLLEQKKLGRIRHFGFSFHDAPEVLETICAAHPWDFAQIQLNYLDWENYHSREQYEILQKYNIPCIVMEPVHGGSLADLGPQANAVLQQAAPGKSIASWAMRYAASLPGVLTVLSGMSNGQQLADNLATYSPFAPLHDAERAALDEALALYRGRKSIPCTACRYCMPCPVGVNIPGIFALYNTGGNSLDVGSFTFAYGNFPQEEKGNLCIDCGACAAVCPQQLAVPQLLHRLAAGEEPMG